MVATSRREAARRRRARCAAHAAAAAGDAGHAQHAGSRTAARASPSPIARCAERADRTRCANWARVRCCSRAGISTRATARSSTVTTMPRHPRSIRRTRACAIEGHGTGCTLASAIAANLCLGLPLPDACARGDRLRARRPARRLSPGSRRRGRARSLRRGPRAMSAMQRTRAAAAARRRPPLQPARAHSRERPQRSVLWLPALGVAAKHYLPLADALAATRCRGVPARMARQRFQQQLRADREP